ncbi:DUF1127 domain-containing protein [Antarcticirhabdus aurantiaca]|uniref:DUF1127 domain-containing protein n=1 Tax=Antarcticirhabdus aurantiaca TaxID=2606717 RepID=A0ACD4NM14_9HYPH|nr:DUF1127 domain-containing protein [Antarcticirhabdus aurantiaca]WAJ27793.1 DUF1127 domain-containing protein [Jeongeuplla avenae]
MFRFFTSGLQTLRSQHRSIRELQSMDDRALADIGVNRAEISRVVRYGRG